MSNPFVRVAAPLVLASASPRRAALLRDAGIPFRVIEPRVSEAPEAGWGPLEHAVSLALRKAREVAGRVDRGVVLGADTLVVIDGVALGKPASEKEARDMLRLLSGRTHEVITGLAIVERPLGREVSDCSRTLVTMRAMSDGEIDAYVRAGDSMDKAGAYAIQGPVAAVVERIDGCYFNVVGLPIEVLARLLNGLYAGT